MSPIRRIIASYGRCRRYSSFFDITVIESEIIDPSDPRRRYTWFATAKLRGGKVFCRALNVDVRAGQWRVRVEPRHLGKRKSVPDITEAFADWLESVEDELGNAAMRGLVSDLASPFFTHKGRH